MGIFFRKSVSFGPVRLNFSKSGVGVSAGIKGLRAGVTSRGKSYVAGGRYGIYFRHSLSDNEPAIRNVEAGGHWLGVILLVFALGFIVAKLIG
jgi:uncharacterized protein DUF4236